MKRFCVAPIVGFGLLLAAVPAMASSSVDDDFSDGVRGAQWSAYTQAPGVLDLSEGNDHLSLISAGGGSSGNDALYLSNFQLSTAHDFSAQISYTLAGTTGSGSLGDQLGLTFGVGSDLAGTDSAAIGVGYGSLGGGHPPVIAATSAYRVNDVQTSGPIDTTQLATGTLEIDYASLTDTLTLKRVGSSYSYTLPAGTVRDDPAGWNADALYISFGGRGSGISTAADQVYLTNFQLLSGTIVPEPAALALLSIVPLVALRQRKRPIR